jgi:hypothetical protein
MEDLAALPVSTWRYRNSDEGLHMGTMAEDFARAFELGKDARYIATIDADGVALAAAQELYRLVRLLQKRAAI